jgi:activating signal cointegrator 1
MMALTLYQPHATLMAIGAKPFETRGWFPHKHALDLSKAKYRAKDDALAARARARAPRIVYPVAIHASSNFPPEERRFCIENDICRAALARTGYHSPNALPLGALVAVVEFIRIIPTQVAVTEVIGGNGKWTEPARIEEVLTFGDFAPGRWAWEAKVLAQLEHPIVMRGARGIWQTEDEDPVDGSARTDIDSRIYRQCDRDGMRWWPAQGVGA